MDHRHARSLTRVVGISAIAELGTGLALVVVPAQVIGLLLEPVTSETVIPVARIAGIALCALAIACWPGRMRPIHAALPALLTYNAVVAVYLAAMASSLEGVLLWPAVAAHALIAVLLLYFGFAARRQR